MNEKTNSVTLIGRVGYNPTLTKLEGGKMQVRFSLATFDTEKDQSGQIVETTTWHEIISDIKENFDVKKGDKIQVDGKLNNISYLTRKGEKRYVTVVNAIEITKK